MEPSLPTPPRAEVDARLFEDKGVPDLTAATADGATNRAGAHAIADIGFALQWYRCRLNAAGVALAKIAPLASCEQVLETPGPVREPG